MEYKFKDVKKGNKRRKGNYYKICKSRKIIFIRKHVTRHNDFGTNVLELHKLT